MAQRHPLLLASVASYLQGHEWVCTDQAFDDLLTGRHAEELNEETIRRLLLSVAQAHDRDLLYRLNLVHGTFDFETVRDLAAVTPAIPIPRERMSALSGLWVQRDSEHLFRVSPLIGALGREDLDKTTLQACYHVLVKRIFQQGTLTPLAIENAISYLNSANDHDQAVRVLIFGLIEISNGLEQGDIDVSQATRFGFLPLLWNLPAPEGVDLDHQLLLRAFQVHLGTLLGRDITHATSELATLIERAGDNERSGLMAVAIYAVPHLAQRHFPLTCRCLLKAVSITTMHGSTGEEASSLPDIPLTSLLWLNLAGIQGKEEVLQWCDTIGHLAPEAREKVLTDPRTTERC